ncbi:MAG: GntR family transcriptional regulator [Leucobacter sp.]
MGEAPRKRFHPIRQESTSALIARSLRDAVARGRFGPGQQLFEQELAGQFGVSRGLLREAMQRLTQEGLLVSRPNRGVFVAEYGPDEVFDIYTARLAIERAACLKVIEVTGRSSELALALHGFTNELELRIAEEDSSDDLVALDIGFHERMVAEADSPRLSRMYETLATESRMCVAAFEGGAYPLPERIAEHRAIAEAIREQDVPLLHRLLAEHMDHAMELITERMRSAE